MFSARARPSKWDRFLGLFRNSKKDAPRQEAPKIEEVKLPEFVPNTVRKAFGERFPYIVRLGCTSPLHSHNLWHHYDKALEWCHSNTDGLVDVKLFAHLPEENGDWILPPSSYNTKDSVFFAFADEADAIIFAIKFKR